MTERITTKPYASRRQQRWAHGSGQPFARRWDKETTFAGLPERKDADAGAMLHGPGGMLAAPGMGGRRPRKGRKWGMRTKDKQIVGNLYRSDTGRFTAGSGPSNPDAPPSFGKAPEKPKKVARGRKVAAAKKPKKIVQTPNEKRAARATEQATNRANVLSGLNIAPDGQAALDALRGGAPPDPKAIERGGFEAAGLVERATDGSYRMTASGRAAMAAAAAGDAGRAGSIISSARDRVGARTERTSAAAAKREQVAQRRAETAARRAANKPAKRMTKPGGDIRQGVQDVARQARTKNFIVYKDHAGRPRWLARTTTSYRDRDNEIISSDALDQDSQRMTTTKAFGPLRYWHIGTPDPFDVSAPWGPGLDIGDCDYSALIGRTRIESGTFRDQAIAQKVARQADQYELSPGFFHPLDQPSDGVFHAIRTFERSIVPTRYGRASNLFTGLAVKESRMDVAEMERRFKAAITDLGLDAAQAQQLGAQLVATEKEATAQGIAFKSELAPEEHPDLEINGVVYKAFPPKAAADAPMDAMVPDEETPPEDVAEVGIEESADEMSGDYIGDMSWDEFAAKLSELLAPVLKMQDMMKAMGDMHGELKTMYGGVAQKDDARAAELTALKSQLAEVTAKIATIEGDQPAVILPDDVAEALKSAGPATPAKPENPALTEALNDPARPWAGWAAKTFPELYGQNGENA